MANVDILIEALENIQSYGQGVCPDLAKKVLVDYGNAEFADSQQAVEADKLPHTCPGGVYYIEHLDVETVRLIPRR